MIQGLRDGLQRLATGGHLKDATDYHSLFLIDNQLFCGRVVHRNGIVPVAATACVLPPQHPPFQTTMRFLGKFLHVEAVHHSVDSDQHMRLLIVRVDALTDGDQPDAGKVQPLKEGQCILGVSGEAAAVVEQDHIEGTGSGQCRIEQTAQPWTIRAHATYRFIDVDVFLQKDELARLRVFAADAELVVNREWTLKIAGVAGIGGATKNHGSLPSLWDVTSEPPVVASRFRFSISARYSRTSAGMMTLSIQDLSAGSSRFPRPDDRAEPDCRSNAASSPFLVFLVSTQTLKRSCREEA